MSDGTRADRPAEEDWGEVLFEQARREMMLNPEPRCACALVVDTSGSMEGAPIAAVNEGVRVFRDEVIRDDQAKKRVEVGIVTFGGEVKVVQNFVTVDQFEPPTFVAAGQTPMGAAILRSIDLLDQRKSMYRQNGVMFYRPWLMLITDGEPEGEPEHLMAQAAQSLRKAEEGNHLLFFPIGAGNANMLNLAKLSSRLPPRRLRGLRYRELFEWLANSMERVSHSRPGDKLALPPRDDWEEVSV